MVSRILFFKLESKIVAKITIYLNLHFLSGTYYPNAFKKFKELSVEIYKYKPTYEDDIRNSDFIIGHGGY